MDFKNGIPAVETSRRWANFMSIRFVLQFMKRINCEEDDEMKLINLMKCIHNMCGKTCPILYNDLVL